MGKKRIVVAMSGGVDSTTVAAILKQEGHEVIGITMQLLDYKDAEGGCCSLDHVIDARRVAQELDIPHYVVNFIDSFKELVLKDYVAKYESGKTPIPCVLCNQYVKFDLLLKRAMELGADYLATGHYAKITNGDGTYSLNKADDENKDQTYFLYTLKQKELSKLMFPLGSLKKDEVRELARSLNIKLAEKPDSTGVCFVPSDNYRDYLISQSAFTEREGDIVNVEGEVLGKHRGIYSFTIGQRRGLGIATGKPMYVVGIEPKENRVIVGEEDKIYSNKLLAENISWVQTNNQIELNSEEPFEVKAKIRNRHREDDAIVTMKSDTQAEIEFINPQRAITPGQAVVLYQDKKVLGGGWINRML
ncbi:MAG: tRNA 2-thiouridine(34) synthase MnmA [Thermodesulfobacteriales bacterium]|nr:MAG: tRNA 2-thiouridine(34) synthase MnmA [Thermodesulfobacteriales bacterium]